MIGPFVSTTLKAFPTLKLFKDDKLQSPDYAGDRTVNAFSAYLQDKAGGVVVSLFFFCLQTPFFVFVFSPSSCFFCPFLFVNSLHFLGCVRHAKPGTERACVESLVSKT